MIPEPLRFLHDRKTTLPGLREALNAVPSRPARLSFTEYAQLDPAQKELFDQAREDYLRLAVRVKTPEQAQCAGILRTLMRTNPRLKNSRRGLMISAPMFYGKTELALLLARSVERQYAAAYPDYEGNGEVPVVWVEMTEHSTGKALLIQIVEFLCPEIVVQRHVTTDRLRRIAVDALHRHKTRLLIIDEAHKLRGSEPSSIIKALQNESSATVVLVGIDLEGGKAFGDGDGHQVTMRCDLVRLGAVEETPEGMAAWTDWVIAFDRAMPLCDHRRGVLTRNAASLFAVASGRLAILAMIVDRLMSSILSDPDRTDEYVTSARLYAVLDTIRLTTPVKHEVRLDDLFDAA